MTREEALGRAQQALHDADRHAAYLDWEHSRDAVSRANGWLELARQLTGLTREEDHED